MPALIEMETDEWAVMPEVSLDAGEGIAGGGFSFLFLQVPTKTAHRFVFVGLGLGAGAKSKLAKALKLIHVGLSNPLWDELDVNNPFSADDLDRSVGQIISLGAGAILGGELLLISGGISLFHGAFFRLCSVSGFKLGALGVGGSITTGMWVRLGRPILLGP